MTSQDSSGSQLTKNIAKHFREVHFGGNWTASNLRDQLKDVTWQQATTQVYSLNTIATLVNHINYYMPIMIQVLEGGPLEGKDELSFAHPPINSEEDWRQMVDTALSNAEKLADLMEKFPEDKLWEDFTDKKYQVYYRHMHGITEHTHYHLGQIAIIKKIVQQQTAN